jgi:hypothetical protein
MSEQNNNMIDLGSEPINEDFDPFGSEAGPDNNTSAGAVVLEELKTETEESKAETPVPEESKTETSTPTDKPLVSAANTLTMATGSFEEADQKRIYKEVEVK